MPDPTVWAVVDPDGRMIPESRSWESRRESLDMLYDSAWCATGTGTDCWCCEPYDLRPVGRRGFGVRLARRGYRCQEFRLVPK